MIAWAKAIVAARDVELGKRIRDCSCHGTRLDPVALFGNQRNGTMLSDKKSPGREARGETVPPVRGSGWSMTIVSSSRKPARGAADFIARAHLILVGKPLHFNQPTRCVLSRA